MLKTTAIVIAITMGQLQLARSQEAPPFSQLTSRGNIAWQTTEDYKRAIESCYHGKSGDMPQGTQFLTCLEQLVRSESASLDAVYSGTILYLKSSSSQTAKLRQSQQSWLQFQVANCGFAKAVAPKDNEDEFYFDCVLRSTIDRRVELRSLVGD